MDELRSYAMKLHTKEQAPREGQASAPKNQPEWKPTKSGYLKFLVESHVVYETFEVILKSGSVGFFKDFVGTGLERTAALNKDIAYMEENFGLNAHVPSEDGPGHQYAALLKDLAVKSPPAFMCHYYNFYFAHTAGGRMIGAQVSKGALDMWMGDFYKWEGDVKGLLNAVRGKLNVVADGWSREEKDACLEETMRTFSSSGSLLRLIAE
jgi:heme oxygenase